MCTFVRLVSGFLYTYICTLLWLIMHLQVWTVVFWNNLGSLLFLKSARWKVDHITKVPSNCSRNSGLDEKLSTQKPLWILPWISSGRWQNVWLWGSTQVQKGEWRRGRGNVLGFVLDSCGDKWWKLYLWDIWLSFGQFSLHGTKPGRQRDQALPLNLEMTGKSRWG